MRKPPALPHPLVLLVGVLISVVGATACSATTLVPSTTAQDLKNAEAILLVGADIGPDFVETPRSPVTPDDEAEILAELQRQPACDKAVASLERFGDVLDIFPPAQAEAESPRWADAVGNEVTFDVSIYATEERAAGLFDAMVDSNLSDCYAAAFPALVEDLLDDDPSFSASSVIVEEIQMPRADNSYGYRMQITLHGPDSSVVVSTEIAMLRHGRVVYGSTLSTLAGRYQIEEDIAPLMWQRLFDVNVLA